MYSDDQDAEMYIEYKEKNFRKQGLPIDIEYPFELFFDTKLFTAYKGDVLFQNECLVGYNTDGKLHQDPIKIADGENTEKLTPRDILKMVKEAVVVDGYNADVTHHMENDLRPLFVCAMHNTLEAVQVCQSKCGVLIRFLYS